VSGGEIRLSELLRLRVVDAAGDTLSVLDVRTAQPATPDPPRIVGLLCSKGPRLRSFGLKRHDAGFVIGPNRVRRHGRFVPWHEIESIGASGIQIRCRFAELERIEETGDPGAPAPVVRT
jgi:hypothetical protein